LLADPRVDKTARDNEREDFAGALFHANNFSVIDHLHQRKLLAAKEFVVNFLDIACIVNKLSMCEFLLSLALAERLEMEDNRIKIFIHVCLTRRF